MEVNRRFSASLIKIFIIKSKCGHKTQAKSLISGAVGHACRRGGRVSHRREHIFFINLSASSVFFRRTKALFILEYSRVWWRKSLDCHCGGLIILLSDEGDTTAAASRDAQRHSTLDARTPHTTHGSSFYCPRSNYGVIQNQISPEITRLDFGARSFVTD